MNNDDQKSADDFEREKWRTELAIREREVALKERTQVNQDQELILKRAEYDRSKWNNPLVVAIIAAALAGLANAVVTGVNDLLQRRTEADKAESARILEMIRAKDVKTAGTNLQFLLEAGLILDPERVQKLKEYQVKHPEGGPILPVASERFSIEPTPALDTEAQTTLQQSLNDYVLRFDRLGFGKPKRQIPIRVEETKGACAGWVSCYDPNEEAIFISPSIKGDLDAPRREYTHFILLQDPQKEKAMDDKDAYLLESDLADYFVASAADRPELYEEVEKSSKRLTSSFRSLSNQRTFDQAEPADLAYREGREVWGGAFWEIRQRLDHDLADRILATAWRTMSTPDDGTGFGMSFLQALIKAADAAPTRDAGAAVRETLARRKFPLPK